MRRLPPAVLTVLEVLLIAASALCVASGYLSFDPAWLPNGTDFPFAVQSHFVWQELARCGACVFWNGQVNGGSPAFADPYGAVLHPLTLLTTLLFGVANGSKVLVLCALLLAGLGQWFLGRTLGLGRFARTLLACVAVAGGHLAGKMEVGIPAAVLSVASASLILAPALELIGSGKRRALPFLAGALALTWLSGQGYIQVGVLAAWFPALLILLAGQKAKTWAAFAAALGLSLLLAGVFLVPMLHFLPNFAKYSDPYFRYLQPLAYIPLNLLIDNLDFYRLRRLGHEAAPYNYILFIGWVPLLLAAGQALRVTRQDARRVGFLAACAVLPFVIASAEAGQLYHYIPSAAGMRNLPLATSLAVPPILGLAGMGLQSLQDWAQARWIPPRRIWLRGLILALAALLVWLPPASFSRQFYTLYPLLSGEHGELTSASVQWSAPAFDDNQWVFDLLQKGVKVTGAPRPWWWKGRDLPPASVRYVRTSADGRRVFEPGGGHYAAILVYGRYIPCQAAAVGGNIDLVCDAPGAGLLTVYENTWEGWHLWIDGQPAALSGRKWLEAAALPGMHTYAFRYQPWDAWLGLSFTILGLAIICYLLFKTAKR